MGNPYTEVSVTNYNSDPPSDDGQETANNEITWAKHKTKLTDPVKTALDTTQSNITSAFAKRYGNDTFTTGSNHTVTVGQEGRILEGTATLTFTLPASATAGSGYIVGFSNTGSGTVTVDGNSTETINGDETVDLAAGEYMWISSDGTNWTIMTKGSRNPTPLPRGYIDGLILSNNSAQPNDDLDIAAGAARDDTDVANLNLTSAITKQIDASWAVGTNQGMLDGTETVAGTPDADTTYHIFLIRRSDTGVVDVLASENVSTPTLPTNYDEQRRIGAVITDGSANIVAFLQMGDWFFWDAPKSIQSASSTSGDIVLDVGTVPAVPTGLKVFARISAHLKTGTGSTGDKSFFVIDPDITGAAAGRTTNFNIHVFQDTTENEGASGTWDVWTDTSGQVNVNFSAGIVNYDMICHGWMDQRGKNG